MSDAAIEERFADLDYPGRRKPVNRDKSTAPSEPVVWDARPAFYKVGGERREFYTISHLSKALGYSQQSIRAWEAARLMPPAPFRSPRTKKPVANGRSNKGRRLWTHDAITGILRLAKKHKVILPNAKGIRNPPTPAFAQDVAKMFRELQGENQSQ
jgi:hypothetical protein